MNRNQEVKDRQKNIDLVDLGHLMDLFKIEAAYTQTMDSNSLSDFIGWLLYNINSK